MSPALANALADRIAAWREPWPKKRTKVQAVVDAIMTGRHAPLGPLKLQLELERLRGWPEDKAEAEAHERALPAPSWEAP